LGSEPSKTEEKHQLPNPEFSSVFFGCFFEKQFCEFVVIFVLIDCLSTDFLKQRCNKE